MGRKEMYKEEEEKDLQEVIPMQAGGEELDKGVRASASLLQCFLRLGSFASSSLSYIFLFPIGQKGGVDVTLMPIGEKVPVDVR